MRKPVRKNLEVLSSQFEDYMVEVNHVIIPGIRNAEGFRETVHKLSAFGEEWFDKMPRLSWYLTLTGVVSYFIMKILEVIL